MHTSAHHWLYHCNFGYPLLDRGTRFIYSGRAECWVVPPPAGQDIVQPLSSAAMNRLVTVDSQADGTCRVGLINDRLKLGLELVYPARAFPRLAHWQHYGPSRSYAAALEPFHGSLLGRAHDRHPSVESTLAPGESRSYSLRLRVLHTPSELRRLATRDGPVQPVG